MTAPQDKVLTEDRLDSLEKFREDAERQFREAFPAGDHHGHRRYHELMIEQIEETRRLRIAVKEKIISGLAWVVIIAIGIAVWQWVKREMSLP